MFWSRWRSFDPADGLKPTGIVDCRIGGISEHAGKRLTKLQRRARIFGGNISEIAHVLDVSPFRPVKLLPAVYLLFWNPFLPKRYFSRTANLSPSFLSASLAGIFYV